MRVLVVSHSAIIDLNRRPLDQIARLRPDWKLRLLTPAALRAPGSGVRYECEPLPPDRGYELVSAPICTFRHQLASWYRRSPTRLVREFEPDLIHIDEEPHSAMGYQLTRVAAKLGLPRIIYSSQNIPRRYPPPFSWFEMYCLRHANFVFALNEDALANARHKGYSGPAEITPFGFDENVFFPPDPDERAERRRQAGIEGLCVAFAGTLSERKGVPDLLDALRRVGARCSLLVLGRGPLSEAVAATRTADDWPHQTVIPGQIPHRDVGRWLQLADVLVLPSRSGPTWKEQFGRVLVEAMACGATVVGSDSGEIPRVIGDAGIVFPERDVAALAATLEGLATDRRRLSDLKAAALARANSEFRWADLARQRCALYKSVVAAAREFSA